MVWVKRAARWVATKVGQGLLWSMVRFYFRGKLVEQRVRVNGLYAANANGRIVGHAWERQGSEEPYGIKLKVQFTDVTKMVSISRMIYDYGLKRWYFQEG